MINVICLEENYSTTRLLVKGKPEIINNTEDKFESILFLGEGENRKGEGGLRTQGYFKKSYEEKPLISIITVVYNGELFLEETIQSVINQSYDNVEYIIIDGGSTDGTLDIIKKYEDKIDYWVSERDRGISDAFNKGLKCVTGDLVGIINADDYYEDNILNAIVDEYNSLEPMQESIIYGKTFKITIENKKLIKKDNKRSWCMSVPFSHCSSFISNSYYKRYGIYDLNFKIAMDIDLLTRGIGKSKYIEIDTFLATQRDGGISDINRIKGYKEYIKASSKCCPYFKSYFFYLVKVLVVYKNKVFK